MSGKETELPSLPQETARRFRLYQPLLRLWKYRNKRELTISLISEYLDVPVATVLEDFTHCPQWNSSAEDVVELDSLIDCIDFLLGEKEFKEALLVGVGKLGTSLLKNETIAGSGLKIVAAFDIDPDKVGKVLAGIKVQSMDKLESIAHQMHLKMAMIATTPENAQLAVDQVARAGVQVVWNFTQTVISPIDNIVVQNTRSALDLENDYQQILSRL